MGKDSPSPRMGQMVLYQGHFTERRNIMIDEKRIKEATEKYLEEEGYKPYIEKAFQDGAEWAQEEFVKSLWHDASEKPKLNTYCIGYYKDFSGCVVFNNPSDGADWDTYVQHSSLSKWCYVDDILPKEGGEE